MAIHSFEHSEEVEAGISGKDLGRIRTIGGHIDDRTQPGLPVVHRRFANPAPLGLLSFATGVFLISIYGVDARGASTPNVFVGVLVFLTGICQVLAGIMEFITGNTFGATVFSSFGAFSLSYAMIYLPGSGILAAYTDATTGKLNAEFPQALAMYIWAWFILTIIFTVGAMRSSWVLLCDLVCVDLLFLVQAIGLMTGNKKCDLAASALGFLVAFLTYWAGAAGLWAGGMVPFSLPTFSISHDA